MVKDRLSELKDKSSSLKHRQSKLTINEDEAFFDEFSKLAISVKELEEWIDNLNRMRKDILANVKNDPLFNAQAENLEKSIMERTNTLNKGIEELKKQLQDSSILKENPTKSRIFSSQINSISLNYVNLVSRLSNQQLEFKENLKKQIQLKCIIGGKSQISEEELERIIESPETFCHFTDNLLAETEEAKKQLMEIEDRHKQIIDLEKSINELRDLFVSFNTYVFDQGSVIDNIFMNVQNAKEHGSSAKEQLKLAVTSQKSARKKKIICLIIVIVVLLIIIISIAIERSLK